MSRERGEEELVPQQALEAAAEERAVMRASIAASTIQLRLLHSLVPVVECLELLELVLRALKGPDYFRKQHMDMMTDLVEHLATRAGEAAAQVHRQADGLDFPLAQEVERFRKMGAHMGTLAQMRHELASLDAADWDNWLDDLQTKGNDDE